MEKIPMVDLKAQYLDIKEDIDQAITNVIQSTQFVQGTPVREFESQLAKYLNVRHVISCGNGTDAIQLALMALDLKPGDEVITPAFSYIACVEMMALLGIKPVLVDVDDEYFNIDASLIENAISEKTRAIMPVHLFGQACDMDRLMAIAMQYKLHVIEDNAQSIACRYTGATLEGFTGTLGTMGTCSFFPSKNLACYGDGGAVFTNDFELAVKLRMTAGHGQSKKYIHDRLGINSRLDTIQAAVLKVNLGNLDRYTAQRRKAADLYDRFLGEIKDISIPARNSYSNHVFHQYTISLQADKRDALKHYLSENGIATSIYYPLPIHQQKAYRSMVRSGSRLENSIKLSEQLLSLPIHSHINEDQIAYICNHISIFMNM